MAIDLAQQMTAMYREVNAQAGDEDEATCRVPAFIAGCGKRQRDGEAAEHAGLGGTVDAHTRGRREFAARPGQFGIDVLLDKRFHCLRGEVCRVVVDDDATGGRFAFDIMHAVDRLQRRMQACQAVGLAQRRVAHADAARLIRQPRAVA